MNQPAIDQAAQALLDAWNHGEKRPKLDGSLAPASMDEGYAIQARLVQASGHDPIGWKIAATSVAGQRHIAADGPIAGRLLRHRCASSPAEMPIAGNAMRVAEAEFAFVIGDDLAPRARAYSREEVLERVAALHPAIELPDSRFAAFVDVGPAQLAADNACAHQFILGAAVEASWRDVDLAAHPIELIINDTVVTQGRGRDALGDPRDALTWLANCSALAADGLRAGQIVTTGVCGLPSTITEGDEVIADFGRFGQVTVRMI